MPGPGGNLAHVFGGELVSSVETGGAERGAAAEPEVTAGASQDVDALAQSREQLAIAETVVADQE